MSTPGTQIEGAAALVTGGNRGFGRALVNELLARGAAKVYATSRLPHPTRDDQAAEGIVWAATAPEPAGTPGALYMRHKQLTLKGAATDSALRARVWAISEEQTGFQPTRSADTPAAAAGQSNG